uniref:PEST proteolytic signal-containing nuclear protein n=1 Tax=Panagrellus redivivus TaxID=6233 RepID=A0A7E4UQ85_PANRE
MCFRKKKQAQVSSDPKTVPSASLPVSNSKMVAVEVLPAGAGDKAVEPQPPCTTPHPPEPKTKSIDVGKGERTGGQTKSTTLHTVDDIKTTEQKSKLVSAQSHTKEAPQQKSAMSKPSQVPQSAVNKSKKGKPRNQASGDRAGGGSKRPDGANKDESEKFEEGEDKSREDPSIDDTLKGVGTEMPHFEG